MVEPQRPGAARDGVTRAPFGRTSQDAAVERITLRAGGIEAEILTYGAVLRALRVPGRELVDVVLGYDDVAGYERDACYMGAVVGRCAGRITNAAFTLDGVRHKLSPNAHPHHLHGGWHGFNSALWSVRELVASRTSPSVTLGLHSADGEEGYPGNVEVEVRYTVVAAERTLRVEYRASTDRATPLNLTQHAYFDLSGGRDGDVLGHEITIDAANYAPLQPSFVPTGTIEPLAGTPLDLRALTRIGARISQDFPQLKLAGGFDQSYILERENAVAVRVQSPSSGISMDVRTTEPVAHFYTGNNIPPGTAGKDGRTYGPRSGLCIETQHLADSPNHPNFPSVVLLPGREYASRTAFAFGVISSGAGVAGAPE